jgi:Cof subfamily protein (haloacid dehalogenase superfamily)
MELWDAYDEYGNQTGETLVRGEEIPDGLYHMVCEVLVRHADGSVLCMKRAESKPNYGGFWEATAGGSALQGEDRLACVTRELREETGLVCRDFRYIGTDVDGQSQTIYHTFVCTVDCGKDTVTLQEGETEAYRWLTPAEFKALLRTPKMIAMQTKRFLPYYKEQGWFAYRLLALDMDGTLLNSKGELSPGNRLAIKEALAAGVQVTISTGRSLQGALWCAEELGLTCPLIVYNGGMLAKVTGEILYSKEMLPADALLAMEEGVKHGVTLCIWSKGKLYGYPLNERTADYVRFSGVEPLPVESLEELARQGVTKVLWYGTKEEIPGFWEEMKQKPFANTHLCPSQPMFLEFFHGEVSKAAALAKLGEALQIPREEIIAMGDGANDLELIAYAGLGVAMGNATDAVKKKADAVTLTNDKDGVAAVIEKYLL